MSNHYNQYSDQNYLKFVHAQGLSSKEEENKLKNDPTMREKIIHQHLRMVLPIAKKYAAVSPSLLEDLIQEGNLGLLYAVDNFDPSKRIRFSVYAKRWISEFVKRRIYKQNFQVNIPYRKVHANLVNRYNEAKKIEGNQNAKDYSVMKKALSLDQLSESFENQIQDPNSGIEETLDKKWLEKNVKNGINHLSQEEKELIMQLFFSKAKMSYKKVSEELKMSVYEIRKIEKGALNKIEKLLNVQSRKIEKERVS